ncbi:unnamed protein product, partial [Mesorhabditis spiculigera]
MKFVLALAAVVVVALAQRPTPGPCQICDYLIAQAVHHFHNNINDKGALLTQLTQECNELGRYEGQDAVTQCKAMVAAQIDTIYADLTAGKDPWQTCFDLHECFGTEPTHGTRPSQGPEAVARGARYF